MTDVTSLAHARADRIIRLPSGGLIETSRLPWTGRQLELGLESAPDEQSHPTTAERHSDDRDTHRY